MPCRVVLCIGALLLAAPAAHAGMPSACDLRVVKAFERYATKAYTAMRKCEERRASGALDPAVRCHRAGDSHIVLPITDEPTAAAVERARALVLDASDACPGSLPRVNEPCLQFDPVVAEIPPCLTTTPGTASTDPATVDVLVRSVFTSPAPVADGALRQCQRTIAVEAGRYLGRGMKAHRRCLDDLATGKRPGPCPDAATLTESDKARARFAARIRQRCPESVLPTGPTDPRSFGRPCEAWQGASFRRSPTPLPPDDNALPLADRFVGCMVAWVGGVTERLARWPWGDPEDTSLRWGVFAGDATADGVVFGAIVPDPVTPVTLDVARDAAFTQVVASVGVPLAVLDIDSPYSRVSVHHEMEGLDPDTTYHYRFRQGADPSRTGTVRTAPAPDAARPVRLGWVAGTYPFFAPFALLDRVRAAEPDAWLFTGDAIVAADARYAAPLGFAPDGSPEPLLERNFFIRHRLTRRDPALRSLLASAGVYAQWDDGDVWIDAAAGNPALAERFTHGRAAFRRFFPVRDGGDPDAPLYRSIRLGAGVEVFLLDARSARSAKYVCCNSEAGSNFITGVDFGASPCGASTQLSFLQTPACLTSLADPARTILGAEQTAWLLQALAASTATFKLVHGPALTDLVYDPYDQYGGWPTERDALLGAIELLGVANVVWLSSDRQVAAIADGVDPVHALPEVMGAAAAVDTAFRTLPGFLQEGVALLPVLAPTFAALELDRPHVVLIDVDPTASPATLRFDFVDHAGVAFLSKTFTAAP